MKLNFKLFAAISAFFFVGFLTSCEDNCDNCPAGTECINDICVQVDPCENVTCAPNQACIDGTCVTLADTTIVKVTGNITANTTWTTGKCYILTGRTSVVSGATLTIQPGVIVKGEAGQAENATALIIARGGKLLAEGTASSPIIFTSVADEIKPGQVESPNLATNVDGLWGGLIVLGSAPISADADAVQIEGIPPSDQNGLYGGTNVADNSGVIKYVSIRHGGANIGDGNEINGLTLGGVGNGTIIENVEVVATQDDGIEVFGGSVNIKNAIVWGAGDDQFDVDQAYTGTIDNFIAVLGDNSDHGLELDGPEGTREGSFMMLNGTLKGNLTTANGEYADLRSDVRCELENIHFTGFNKDADLTLSNQGVSDNWFSGKIVLSNLEFNVSHLTEGNITIPQIFKDGGNRDAEFNAAAANFAKIVTAKGATGAKSSDFGWTLTSKKGQLAGL